MADPAKLLAYIIANPDPAEPIGSSNGYAGIMDVAMPVDFIDEAAKMVLDQERHIDWPASFTMVLYHAQAAPAIPTVLTAAHLSAAFERFGKLIVIREIMFLLDRVRTSVLVLPIDHEGPIPPIPAADKLRIEFRTSDFISPVEYANLTYPPLDATETEAAVNAGPAYALMAQSAAMLEYLMADETRLGSVTGDRDFIALAIPACHLHREIHQNHNFLSNQALVRGSTTANCCGVAGAKRDEFAQWMSKNGHDMWHFLSNAALRAVAYGVCGEDAVYAHFGVVYNNNDVGGHFLHDIIKLGDAATDRIPHGTIGISAIIVGISLIPAMLIAMQAKVGFSADTNMDQVVRVMKIRLNEHKLSRAVLMSLRAALLAPISVAAGFASATEAGLAQVRKYTSLVTFTNNDIASYNIGIQIAKSLKEVEVNTESLGAMIQNQLGMMCAAFANIAAVEIVPAILNAQGVVTRAAVTMSVAPNAAPAVAIRATKDTIKSAEALISLREKAIAAGIDIPIADLLKL